MAARRFPLLVTAFVVLAGAAWLMASPPGSPFDEPAHYVKAIGVGHGDLRGRPPRPTSEDLRELFERGARGDENLRWLRRAAETPAVRWQSRTRRQFDVAPELIDPRFGCTAANAGSAACLAAPHEPSRQTSVSTYVGTYQPFAYVAPGLALRAASTPGTALRLARAACLALALALLVAAVWLLWSPAAPALSLLGLVAAVTPMVVFVAAVLSPSGLEIAGAVCFSAALLRLGRGGPAPPWLWIALAAGGAALALARALGPAFVALAIVAVALLVGPRTLAGAARAGGRRAAVAGGAVLLAAVASAAWELAYQPRPSPTGTSARDALGPSVERLPEIAREAIGVFGSLDTPMPAAGYWLWGVLVLGLAAAALVAGTGRDRASVVLLVVAAVVVTLVMSVVYREIGPLHGRYAMPVLVLLPLWLGEVVLRRRAWLPAPAARALVAGGFTLAAAVHALGWWSAARRFAVGGDGDWLWLGASEWAPPAGWWPWVLAAAAAVAAYVAAAVSAPRRAADPPCAERPSASVAAIGSGVLGGPPG